MFDWVLNTPLRRVLPHSIMIFSMPNQFWFDVQKGFYSVRDHTDSFLLHFRCVWHGSKYASAILFILWVCILGVFSMWVIFHRQWQFTWQQGKGGDHLFILCNFYPLRNIKIFIWNYACEMLIWNYASLSNYHLIDDEMLISVCFNDSNMIRKSVDLSFHRPPVRYIAYTILVLEAKRLTGF